MDNVFTIMEKLKSLVPPVLDPDAPPVEDPSLKLHQNFKDLKDAVDNKNKEFFGVTTSTTI